MKNINDGKGTFLSTRLCKMAVDFNGAVKASDSLIDFSNISAINQIKLFKLLKEWPISGSGDDWFFREISRFINGNTTVYFEKIVAIEHGDYEWSLCINYISTSGIVAQTANNAKLLPSSNTRTAVIRFKAQNLIREEGEVELTSSIINNLRSSQYDFDFSDGVKDDEFKVFTHKHCTEYGEYAIKFSGHLATNEERHSDLSRLLYLAVIKDVEVSFTPKGSDCAQIFASSQQALISRGNYQRDRFARTDGVIVFAEGVVSHIFTLVHMLDTNNDTGMVTIGEDDHDLYGALTHRFINNR